MASIKTAAAKTGEVLRVEQKSREEFTAGLSSNRKHGYEVFFLSRQPDNQFTR
ncbi:MAG: hypothetical protein ACM3PQ_00075 [Methanosarcina sp.]